jgi:uncharacterized membrane protein (DUF106 family)
MEITVGIIAGFVEVDIVDKRDRLSRRIAEYQKNMKNIRKMKDPKKEKIK